MGEYAKNIKTGEDVKIGTCDLMYYITLKDRKTVRYDFDYNQVYFWRLPLIGTYNGASSGESKDWASDVKTSLNHTKFWQKLKEQEGDEAERSLRANSCAIHISLPGGSIIQMKCLHGFIPPKLSGEDLISINFSCRSDIRAAYIRTEGKEVSVIARCSHCGTAWRLSLEELEEFLKFPTYNPNPDAKRIETLNLGVREFLDAIKDEIADYLSEFD